MPELLDPWNDVPVPMPGVPLPRPRPGAASAPVAAPSLGTTVIGPPGAPAATDTPHGTFWNWLTRLNEHFRNSPMEQALRNPDPRSGVVVTPGVTTIESSGGWGPDPRAPTGTQVYHPPAAITPGSTKSQERVPQGEGGGGKGPRLDRPGKGDRERPTTEGGRIRERSFDRRGQPDFGSFLRMIMPLISQASGGRGIPPIFQYLLRNLEQQRSGGGPQGGRPFDSSFDDSTADPGMSDDDNVPPSGPLLAPGSADGGEPAARPDTGPNTSVVPKTGGAGAPEATSAPAAGAAADVSAGPAAGGAPPIPPVGAAVVPGPAMAPGGGVLGAADGGAANAPAVGLAPLGPRGALGTIGRTREAAETGVMTAALGANFGQAMNTRLAADRERYRQELAHDPDLRQRLLQVMYNEQGRHPQGVQAIAETALNRASVRKTSLRRQLGWHRLEPHGYYQAGNMGRGMTRYLPVLNQALDNALAGSNIANFATDNSSGGLARRERSSGRFRYRSGYTGESFFAPGWAEPQFARDWDHWQVGMQEPIVAAQ